MARESIADRRRRLAVAALEQTAAQRAEWLAKHREDAGREMVPTAPPGRRFSGSGSSCAGGRHRRTRARSRSRAATDDRRLGPHRAGGCLRQPGRSRSHPSRARGHRPRQPGRRAASELVEQFEREGWAPDRARKAAYRAARIAELLVEGITDRVEISARAALAVARPPSETISWPCASCSGRVDAIRTGACGV